MDQQQPLIEAIEEFIERFSMSAITFGRKAMGDPHFVRDLRSGRRLWPETEDRARRFMVDYKPPADTQAAA